MKPVRKILLAFAALSPAFAAGPAWDSTGNGLLDGIYNFRQVVYVSNGSGSISQQIAYFGNIGFDGNGNYTLSGSNTLLDTAGTLGIPATGTYSVASGGFGFLSNPLIAGASVEFLVSNHILIGSSTETPGANGSYNNDLFIAAPATPTFTNASFNGAYTLSSSLPGRDASFTVTPDGAGHFGTFAFSGYDVTGGKFGGANYVSTYALTGGVAIINNGGSADAGGFVTYYEIENAYLSPDTNFVFGGSPNGYDIFVGVRNATGGTPTLTPGLYYEIGLDQTASIDTYYGAFNAFQSGGKGNIIGHERLLYAGSSAEGVAYTTTYPTGSYTGPANVGQLDPSATVQYTIGAGGIRIGFGIGPWLGIEAAFPTPVVSPLLDPIGYLFPAGIVDTASSTPFTAGISPGEFITIYDGIDLASYAVCLPAGPPFPSSLGGVQVIIDGIPAPIYCVGPQITVIVPYEVDAYPIASIQVIHEGIGRSNIVTTYVYKTTPGVFTMPAGGLGFAAAQHGNYSPVTTANPAQPGETIVVYLTGLGSVLPVNRVGAMDAAATVPRGYNIVSNIEVEVAGFGSTSVPYAGLTPGAEGLYQINFEVPTSAPAGNDLLAIVGPDSYSAQAVLPVGGTGTTSHAAESAPGSVRRRLPRLTVKPL